MIRSGTNTSARAASGKGRVIRTRRVKKMGKAKLYPDMAGSKSKRVKSVQFVAVMKAAGDAGLLTGKSARIGGRVSPALLKRAKKRTGIATDTDLIEFALANVALDDDFGEVFSKIEGTVDPSLKLGF
jgi:hypothetical protein